MSQYIMHFSPTGGTKRCAEAVASAWTEAWKEIDLTDRDTKYEEILFHKEDLVIAAVPSFSGRVPAVAVNRLSCVKGNGAKVVLICVYGNRAYEDTLTELQDVCEAAGFVCIAAVAAIAEHSIARRFAAGRPDAKDQAELKDFGKKIHAACRKYGNMEIDDTLEELILPGNRPYKERGASSARPKAGDRCIACGWCAKQCPVGAIPSNTPQETDKEKCIACMKCIAVCPAKARAVDPEVLAAIGEKLQKVCCEHRENELFVTIQSHENI